MQKTPAKKAKIEEGKKDGDAGKLPKEEEAMDVDPAVPVVPAAGTSSKPPSRKRCEYVFSDLEEDEIDAILAAVEHAEENMRRQRAARKLKPRKAKKIINF